MSKELTIVLTEDQCDMLQKIAQDIGGEIQTDEDAQVICQTLIDKGITRELAEIGLG
jgi:hypothetical protein